MSCPHASGGSFDPALLDVVLSLAMWFGARPQEAEDVAQDALLKLLTHRGPIANPVAWLFVVIRRQVRLRRIGEQPLATTAAQYDPWRAIEFRIDASKCSTEMSTRARKVLSLAIAGYSGREVAVTLGCSVRAAEKSLHKARGQLRRHMGAGTK